MLTLLGDQYVAHAVAVLGHYEIQRKLEATVCRQQAKVALELVKQSVVNVKLIECLDYLISKIEGTGKCVTDSAFKKLSAQYISW